MAQSASGSASTVGSGRVALARQAVALLREYPATGVGPGNWYAAVQSDRRIAAMSPESLPVHNAALYLLVLLGFVGVALAVPAGLRLLRSLATAGVAAAIVLAPVIVALSVDVFLVVFNGRTVLAVAIGAVLGLGRRRAGDAIPARVDGSAAVGVGGGPLVGGAREGSEGREVVRH